MTTEYKKITLLALTGILLLASIALSTWSLLSWNKTGWIGMSITGKWVHRIFFDGPADKAGIRMGDEVMEINGIAADSARQIAELAARAVAGDSVVFRMKPNDDATLYVGTSLFQFFSREKGKEEFLFTTILPPPFKSMHVPLLLVSSTLVAVIFFVIGCFTYWKRPDDRRILVFYLLSAVGGIYFLVHPVEQLTSLNALGFKSSEPIGSFLGLLFAQLLLHFALIFPKPKPEVTNNPYIFRWLYGVPMLLLALVISLSVVELLHQSEISKTMLSPGTFKYSLHGFITAELPFEIAPLPPAAVFTFDLLVFLAAVYMLRRSRKSVKEGGWRQWPFTTMLTVALLALLLVGGSAAVTQAFKLDPLIPTIVFFLLLIPLILSVFVVALYYSLNTFSALRHSYRESGVEEKRQIRWPVLAMLIALGGPFVIVIVCLGYYAVFAREPNALFMLMADVFENALFLFVPLAFAFAIFKYRLMDIDLIIKKTIIYTIITGIIVALYLSLVGGLGVLLFKFIGTQNESVKIFSALAIAAVFVPVRNRVQNIVDRRFFRKKYDYPQALRMLTRETSQAVDLQVMLKLVVEHLVQALQNRAAVIFTKGERERAFAATAKVGVPDEVLGRMKFESNSRLLTMMDTAFELRQQDLPDEEKQKLRKVGGAFIVPVKLKGELIGFISLGTKLSDEKFDTEDREFLAAVADQMTIGIDNLRLREQEKEFEKAREIQQRLLPKKISQISGYEISGTWQPARAVGGDYFDVLKFSESQVGLCIADVVGKGMPAALLMSNLQAAVKAFASDTVPPKELCKKVNRFIRSNLAADKFITFFYCLLDSERKKLIYTRAGHNAPMLIHHDGTPIRLEHGGAVFGLFEECRYEQGEVELASGDRLLLFTDGVSEAMNAEQEEFGEERLTGLLVKNRKLGAAELQNCVMKAVAEFTGGEFQDDVTMIVMAVE